MRRIAIVVLVLAMAIGALEFFSADVAQMRTRYITPLAASISADGTQVSIEAPYSGGCPEDTYGPMYKVSNGSLVIWIEEISTFRCLASCLAAQEVLCTETLVLDLDPPVDPSTPIVFQHPGPGLLPLGFVGLLTGLGLGLLGMAWNRRRSRRFDVTMANSGGSDPA